MTAFASLLSDITQEFASSVIASIVLPVVLHSDQVFVTARVVDTLNLLVHVPRGRLVIGESLTTPN